MGCCYWENARLPIVKSYRIEANSTDEKRRFTMKKKLFVAAIFAVVLALSHPTALLAIDIEGLSIHGFISQGYLKSNDNNYLAETKDGTFEFNETALNFSLKPTDNLRLGVQFMSRDMGPTTNNDAYMDWGYGDYRFVDAFGVRIGKIKAPMGLYNQTRDVDFLRTFILLPQSFYSEIERGQAEAMQGGSVYGNFGIGAMGDLEYEIAGGTANSSLRSPNSVNFAYNLDQSLAGTGATVTGSYQSVKWATASTLRWNTPLDGLRLGFSLNLTENEMGRSYLLGSIPITIKSEIKVNAPMLSKSSQATPPATATPNHELTPAAGLAISATATPAATPPLPTPAPEASAAASPDTSAPPITPAKPWHWALNAAQLTDAKLLVLHPTGRMDVGVAAEVHDLAGEGHQPAAVKLGLTVGEGSLNVDGKLRLAPIGFGGHIVIDKLDVPALVVASRAVPPEILPAARLALDLHADTGSLAPTPGDLNVTGTITLTDVQAAPPAPQGIRVGLRSLTVGVDELHVAGLLAQPGPSQGDLRFKGKISVVDPRLLAAGATDPAASVKTIDLAVDEINAPALLAKAAAEGRDAAPGNIKVRGTLRLVEPRAVAANPQQFSAAVKSIDVAFDEVLVPNPRDPKPGPLRVRLGDVRIAQPNLRVTRTKDGIVLPQLAAATRAPAPASAPVPSPVAAATAASPSIDLSMALFQLSKGRIAFADRAVKPFYSGAISALDIELKGVRFPELAASNVRVDATVAPSGKIKVTGSMGPSGGTIYLKVDDMALSPFNPYATAYSTYRIAHGSVTVATKASFAPGGYKADTSILLHQFDVSSAEGDSLFQQHFGIPLTVALALLRDMSGNITLDVPLEADQEGMRVGVGTIVAGALRSALVGTLTSPLKLIGMVLPGSKEQAAAPPQIVFRAGRAEPAPESEAQIKEARDVHLEPAGDEGDA